MPSLLHVFKSLHISSSSAFDVNKLSCCQVKPYHYLPRYFSKQNTTKYSVKADFLSTTTCQAIFPNKILSQVNTIIQSSENQVKINFTQLAKSNLHPTGSLQYLQYDLSIDWSDFQALLNYLQVPALMDQFTVQILNSLKTVHKFRLLKITWLKVTQVWFYSSIATASFTLEFYAYWECMLQHEFLQSFIHLV